MLDEYVHILQVPSNANPGTTLFTVNANDDDIGRNGEITYTLLPGGGALNQFNINQVSVQLHSYVLDYIHIGINIVMVDYIHIGIYIVMVDYIHIGVYIMDYMCIVSVS